MQHLRQLLSVSFMVALLGGCSNTRHWAPERCPTKDPHWRSQVPAKPESQPARTDSQPVTPEYQPVVYRLDHRRTLEIWDTEADGHFTFLQDGISTRTERLLYCSAAPLFPNGETPPSSPAIRLNGNKSRYVVICQQGDDHYLYTVFKVASGFPKAGQFESKSPLDLVAVGNVYRFSGEDYLPGGGAHQFNPQVLFKLKGGKLKLDRDSMRKRLPTPTELRRIRKYIRTNFKEQCDIPVELIDTVFQFYYAGEVQKAKQFFNSVYQKNVENKAYWWKFLREQIKQSPYRKEIGL